MQGKYGGKKKEHSSNEGDKRVQSKNGKKVLKKIIIELKEEIIEKHEYDIHVPELVSEYKIAKLTVATNLKSKDAIKELRWQKEQ